MRYTHTNIAFEVEDVDRPYAMARQNWETLPRKALKASAC